MQSRRSFLGGAAAAALSRPSAAAPPGMYIALSWALVGNQAPWPEFARLAARVGFGGTDVNLGPAMKEGLDRTRDLLAELKLRASFCGFPVNVTGGEEAFRKDMAGLEAAAKFADAIGCNRMSAIMPPSSQTPKEELRKTLMARFSAAAKVLADHNVRLGFEFLGPLEFRTRAPHEFIWRMKETLEFAEECGPNVGLILDAWHWYHAGATVDDIAAAGKSRIVAIHVSDSAKMPPADVRDNRRLLPGEGVIDLVGFFRALQKTGYQDGVSPEPIGRFPADMPAAESAKMGLDSTLAVMRKAGISI
jgi:sugar phosphate isomerase/epimerase